MSGHKKSHGQRLFDKFVKDGTAEGFSNHSRKVLVAYAIGKGIAQDSATAQAIISEAPPYIVGPNMVRGLTDPRHPLLVSLKN